MDLDKQVVSLGSLPALIVVDMINGFTDPACALGSESSDVVSANQEILGAFREAVLPIFFTTIFYHNDTQARVFRQRLPALNLLTPESQWVEIDEALGRRPEEEIIVKHWASSFFDTELSQKLKAAGVDSLVVTGLTTSGCVRATVLDGLQLDYSVVVPREAVGDRNKEAHEANLHDMNAKYADVMGTTDVVNYVSSL